eukprot:359468-Chlamydomonas_euryale.AAC.6
MSVWARLWHRGCVGCGCVGLAAGASSVRGSAWQERPARRGGLSLCTMAWQWLARHEAHARAFQTSGCRPA